MIDRLCYLLDGTIGLTKAILRIDRADDEEINERRRQCEVCEHELMGRCTLCGCWIRFKTTIDSECCPDDRW